MIEVLKVIITNVLVALYSPFWFSIILSVLFMLVYKQYSSIKCESGKDKVITAIKDWIFWFKSDFLFRRIFFLVFYTVMILFRTLLNRNMWANPVSNVIGIWGLYNEKGELTTECLENLALFIPFSVLLLWVFRERLLSKVTLPMVLWETTKITFFFSFTIEMFQLFLRLGTWQLSDLFYNTLGGTVGGLMYYVGYKIKYIKYRKT